MLLTHHPKAANHTFLLSNGQDVSTTQLLQTLAKAQGAPSRLIPVPAAWLSAALRGNLQVNSSKARALLGCDSCHIAPFSFKAGVADMFVNTVRT